MHMLAESCLAACSQPPNKLTSYQTGLHAVLQAA